MKIRNAPLFNVKIKGKEGCINKNGEIVIEPKFDDISVF